MKKILIISGQTATGKSDLAVYLAKKFNGEILSFDSRQAYKYLNIITGKDINELKVKSEKLKIKIRSLELELIKYFKSDIPIWLYDLVDPKEHLDAYSFGKIAEIVIDDILKRGKLPIIVGGTVFYIKTLLQELGTAGTAPNWELRKELEKAALEKLQKKVQELNIKRFLLMNNSDRNNKRRLIRAIEIAQSQKSRLRQGFVGQAKVKSQNLKPHLKTKNYDDVLFLALVLNKEKLKEKIEKRVEKRIKMGAIEEIQELLKRGYCFDDSGLQTLGYKQLRNYFNKKDSLDAAVLNWIKAEIDYAKRQLTFLKKIKDAVFLNTQETNILAKTEKLVYKWYYDTKN